MNDASGHTVLSDGPLGHGWRVSL